MGDTLVATSGRLLAQAREPRALGLRGLLGDAVFATEMAARNSRIDPRPYVDRCVVRCHAANAMSLHHGLAGLGWLLSERDPDHPLLPQIDAALLATVDHSLLSLQNGVAGLAIYAGARTPVSSVLALRKALVERLARDQVHGLWTTPVDYLLRRGGRPLGERLVEPGMSHGVSGILVGLAALARCGTRGARELIEVGLRALLALDQGNGNHFGHHFYLDNGARHTLPRTWCAGDAGVARGVWLAAQQVGDGYAAELALELVREEAARALAGDLPGDQGQLHLCCGLSSIALIFELFHRETGDRIFARATTRLTTLCRRELGQVSLDNLMFGRMGVVLALLAIDTRNTPTWPALLGIGLPEPGLPIETAVKSSANVAMAISKMPSPPLGSPGSP